MVSKTEWKRNGDGAGMEWGMGEGGWIGCESEMKRNVLKNAGVQSENLGRLVKKYIFFEKKAINSCKFKNILVSLCRFLR